jgi:DNA-binding transcriptional LysR family regulator
MSFDHRRLRAFLTIVDTGSLGRASAAMNLSQPALSRLVRSMEDQLGVPLFERSVNGMTLTAYGEAFLPHVRLLLYEMARAVEELDGLRGVSRGTVRLGAVAAIARSILPAAINRLIADSPGIKIELLEGPDDKLADALVGKQIDLMLGGSLHHHQQKIFAIAECRFGDSCIVACAADHPLTKRHPVSLGHVLSQPWVMAPRGAMPRVLFEELVRATGNPLPRIAVESSSPNVAISLISSTPYLTWLPQPLIAAEKAAGMVSEISVPELTLQRRFYVYRRAHGALPAPAARLLKELSLIQAGVGSTFAPALFPLRR